MSLSTRRLPLSIGLLIALALMATIIFLAATGQDWLLDLLERLELEASSRPLVLLSIYIVSFALLATLALPVGTVFCLTGGYLFGILAGAGAALIGACLAALITFTLARRFGGARLRRRLQASRAAPALRIIERDATWYLVLLRIVPVAPFFAINAAAAVTSVSLTRYMTATGLGLVPTTLVYAAVGAGLNSIVDAREMIGPGILLEPRVGLPLLGLVTVIVASWITRLHLERRNPAA